MPLYAPIACNVIDNNKPHSTGNANLIGRRNVDEDNDDKLENRTRTIGLCWMKLPLDTESFFKDT